MEKVIVSFYSGDSRVDIETIKPIFKTIIKQWVMKGVTFFIGYLK